MNTLNTQVTINLKEGSFSISGAESFVEKNMENLKNFIKENINEMRTAISVSNNQQNLKLNLADNAMLSLETKKLDKYEENGIFYIDRESGEIQILKNVPGKNRASKARNVALILLYAKNDFVAGVDIKKHCIEQACYEQSNFASWFKKKDGCFIRQGTGAKWSLKLTTPGKDEAVTLLESMADVK